MTDLHQESTIENKICRKTCQFQTLDVQETCEVIFFFLDD